MTLAKNKEILEILADKSSIELKVIAKGLKIRNYNRLTNKKLIDSILNFNNPNLVLKLLNVKRPFYKRGLFWAILGVILTIVLSAISYFIQRYDSKQFYDQIKSDVLKTEENTKRLAEIEQLSKSFLDAGFDGGYQVFGTKDRHFAFLVDSSGEKRMKGIQSEIRIDRYTNSVVLKIYYGEMLFANAWMHHGSLGTTIRLGAKGEFVRIVGMQLNEQSLYFVRLNEDLINPVFAIGIKTRN